MNRVRWLYADWGIPMQVLASKLQAGSFKRDDLDGFVIKRVRDSYIEATYIEKQSYKETITDPFGEEQVFERVNYRTTAFSLFEEYPQIELYDAPRSTRGLSNRLLEICDFSLSIIPISIDILEWIESFQNLTNEKVVINSMQASGLHLGHGVTAKVLAQGECDVQESLMSIAGNNTPVFDNLQMKYSIEGKTIPIFLSASGAIKISETHRNKVLPFLRRSLPRIKNRS